MPKKRSGDDLCDLCGASGVTVSRTTHCGKTIGVECGCDEENPDGVCFDSDCHDCKSSTTAQNDSLQKAALQIIETVESTGGLIQYPDGTHAPQGEPDWIDLGDAVLAVRSALQTTFGKKVKLTIKKRRNANAICRGH